MRVASAPMRRIVLLAFAALGCGGPEPAAPTAPPRVAQPALVVADALVDDRFAEFPEIVARLRPPGARYDDLPHESVADVAARDTREDGWRATLGSIDRTSLG